MYNVIISQICIYIIYSVLIYFFPIKINAEFDFTLFYLKFVFVAQKRLFFVSNKILFAACC